MKKTKNFELNQWESTDRILMDDFNNDNDKIDAALGTLKTASESQAATLAQHAATLTQLGNCRIYTTSYYGNGKFGSNSPNTLTFSAAPLVMLVFGATEAMFCSPTSGRGFSWDAASNYMIDCYYKDGTVTWYSTSNANGQMNRLGYGYQVIALLDAAETEE